VGRDGVEGDMNKFDMLIVAVLILGVLGIIIRAVIAWANMYESDESKKDDFNDQSD
jgi:hypothetical protein